MGHEAESLRKIYLAAIASAGLGPEAKALAEACGSLAIESFLWHRDAQEIDGSADSFLQFSKAILPWGPKTFRRKDMPAELLARWRSAIEAPFPGYPNAEFRTGRWVFNLEPGCSIAAWSDDLFLRVFAPFVLSAYEAPVPSDDVAA